MDIADKIGVAIIKRRRELQMTQEDLAGAAEIARSYLSGVEGGKRNVSLEMFVKIAKALEIEPSMLLNIALNPEKKGIELMESKDGMITLPLPKIIKIAESLNVAPEELLKRILED